MFEWICRVDHLRVYEQMNLLIFFIDVLFCDMVLNAINSFELIACEKK